MHVITPATKAVLETIPGFNPFFFEGKQIKKILFFRDGKILGETDWFLSNNETPKVYFDFEISRKIKIDLQTKQAFYTKAKQEYYTRDVEYDLYIHADLVNFKALGEKEHIDTDTHTSFIEHYSVDLFCLMRGFSNFQMHTITFTARRVSRTETKEFGNEIERIGKMLKEKNVNIPSYELQYLVKFFNVTPKQ
jgi:hypothetical protein